MNSDTFIIARAGWKALAAAAGAFLLFSLLDAGFLQFLAFIALAAVGWVYRNPERVVPYYQEQSLTSPADGSIVAIDTVEESPFGVGRPCYRIEIVSGWMETSILRAPFEGRIVTVDLRHGAGIALHNPLAKQLNESALLLFESSSAKQLYAEHRLEYNVADLVIDAVPDHRVAQGTRYGTMLKGKTTLYLPSDSRVSVQVGDTVRAGESLIGYFS